MISIIVAIYNEKNYVSNCIESILGQTYQDLEILLIDDGSTDGSEVICDEYALKDNRIKVSHKNNEGVASARNLGLKMATGDYIMFVDGDDFIHSQFCEILIKYLYETDADLVFTDTFRSNVIPSYEIPLSQLKIQLITKEQMIKRLFTLDSKCYTDLMVWGKIYKRTLFKDMFFKNIIGEDIEFNSRLLQKIRKAVFLDLKLYVWLMRPDSVSVKASIQRDVEELNVWLYCLNNFNYSDSKSRGYALKRFYLNIINRKFKYQKESAEIKRRINEISTYGLKEFKENKSINFGFKCLIRLFLFSPSLYSIFLNIMKYKRFLIK